MDGKEQQRRRDAWSSRRTTRRTSTCWTAICRRSRSAKVLRIRTPFLRSGFSCHASDSLAACLCLCLFSRLPDPATPAVAFLSLCLQASCDPLVSSDQQVLNSHSFIAHAGGILEMSKISFLRRSRIAEIWAYRVRGPLCWCLPLLARHDLCSCAAYGIAMLASVCAVYERLNLLVSKSAEPARQQECLAAIARQRKKERDRIFWATKYSDSYTRGAKNGHDLLAWIPGPKPCPNIASIEQRTTNTSPFESTRKSGGVQDLEEYEGGGGV